MSENQDPVRQNIIDWCQTDNIPCVETSQNNPNFTWSFSLGPTAITIYKQPQLTDRIYIQSQIGLSPEHQTLVNQTWQIPQKNTMMINLKKLAAQYNINMDFRMNGNDLLGFNTFTIHFHSSISKADFLEKFIKLQGIHDIILNSLNVELGIATQMTQTNTNSGAENPAIG